MGNNGQKKGGRPGGRHDGSVQKCESGGSSILAQVTRRENNADVDEPVIFTLTSDSGLKRTGQPEPRQRLFEGLAKGRWTVTAELTQEKSKYLLDGKNSFVVHLRPKGTEFALFKVKSKPWVEVRILDDKSGQGLENLTVRIRPPNAADLLEATTNAEGIARFEYLEPGDHTLEEVLEPPRQPPPPQPLPPLRPVGGEPLELKAGDTLVSLADANKKRVKDWADADAGHCLRGTRQVVRSRRPG